MHARLRGQKKLIYSLPNYKIKLDFPSLADDIPEPRPDMNIKFAAFTVSEKSINTLYMLEMLFFFWLTYNYTYGEQVEGAHVVQDSGTLHQHLSLAVSLKSSK